MLYDCFKHWAAKGSVVIFSDPHFDDTAQREFIPDWPTGKEMVKKINAAHHPNDTLILLGDIGDSKYVWKLKSRHKVLILGNHDKKKDYEEAFDEIYTGPLMIAPKILLSHEPIPGLPFCVNIHGHDHSDWCEFPEGCRHVNLAANMCNYTPMNLKDAIKNGLVAGIDDIHRLAINKQTEENFMDANTYVYCTNCTNFNYSNDDIPCCKYADKCDIWNPEDSKPFAVRPCYEQMPEMPELGNLLFGHSRGEFPVPRLKFETIFGKLLKDLGFDEYGHSEHSEIKEIQEFVYTEDNISFENDIFLIRPYYWGDDENIAILPNFVYKPIGYELRWYKYPLRDSYANINLTQDEFKKMISSCIKSVQSN